MCSFAKGDSQFKPNSLDQLNHWSSTASFVFNHQHGSYYLSFELIMPKGQMDFVLVTKLITFSKGCLGSHTDEERREMRYVVRIARPRESSNF